MMEIQLQSNTDFTISFSTSNTTVSEGVGTVTINVTSDNANDTGGGLTIDYAVTGSAVSGSDYSSLSGSVTLADGTDATTFTISIIDDMVMEDDETIQLAVDPSGNVKSGLSLTITITDNDDCTEDDSLNQTRQDCDHTDTSESSYSESVMGTTRTIMSSGIPNHDFGNQFDDIPQSGTQVTDQDHVFTVTTNPQLANSITSILSAGNRPARGFGVALNGVPIDPAPAEPFIFEDGDGEFNWDWVFEPNNNMEAVGLDCAVAHVQPTGAYHYHGDMSPLAEQYSAGISTGTAPGSPVQIGWASDGFPIIYRYGPNAAGTGVELLTSSYQLKSGDRPGDGIDEPCGTYNGKFTNDYEYVSGNGDLDECNGISRSVTVGGETFSYFYVITEDFPIVPRCLSGTPDSSFDTQ